MDFLLHLCFFLLLVSQILLFLPLPLTSATTIVVGGDKGWVVGAFNYTKWAANTTFYTGDSLVFNYLAEFHTVVEVNRSSFIDCDATDPIASYDNGNTTIDLKEAGSYYFICGVYKHCPLGQKLKVRVEERPKHGATSSFESSTAPQSHGHELSSGSSSGAGLANCTPLIIMPMLLMFSILLMILP